MRAIVLSLSLTLLVLGILADDPEDTLALYDLALIANRFNRRSNLHSQHSLSFVATAVREARQADVRLLKSVGNSSAIEVIRRQLNHHPVSR